MVERTKKCLCLFISFVFVLLFCLVGLSNPTKAVELNQNVSFLGTLNVSSSLIYPDVGNCTIINSGTPYATNNGQNTCTVYSSLVVGSTTGFNTDYIWGINVYLYELRDREAIHGYINQTPGLLVMNYGGIVDQPSFVGYDVKNVSESSVIVTYYFKSNSSGSMPANNSSFRIYPRFGLQQNEFMMFGHTIEVLAVQNYNITVNTNNTDLINAINDLKNTNIAWQQTINTNIQNILQKIGENQTSVQNIENHFDDEKEKAEQQGTDGQNDSNQAGDDVTGATTNLLSAITGFFGAFTSATATTCRTDWGIEGFRNFDFCGTQIPTELRVVFTIVASIIFIPMIWFLINSILSAFKEFQQ